MINRYLFLAIVIFCSLACKKEKIVEVKQEVYIIPGDRFFPEGIAYDAKKGVFYTGSTINGDILRVDVQTGATNLFASGAKQGRMDCRGMKVDIKGRLWVCGGEENKIHVLNSDGNLIKSWNTKELFNSGFINDCVTDENYIYFTDSRVQKIYRAGVANAQPGNVEEWLTFTDQQIPFSTGFNANGAALTHDGKYLIIVISNSGKLYRISRSTKEITEIQLNMPVTSGDGLLLDGNTLYVSRNATGQIFPVYLNNSYTQGTVGSGFGSNLLFNTTIAKAGEYLLVVNGQLDKRNSLNPVLPFTVSRIAIP